jgi:hypothetical protein
VKTNTTQHGVYTNNATETLATVTRSAMTQLCLGARGGTVAAETRIYALLFYNADLDAAAQTRVKKYLYAKYGITP